MAKTLSCDYNFNESNFDMVSPIAKVKIKQIRLWNVQNKANNSFS